MTYRDPTPLNPNKDYSAEELAEFIRHKLYGVHTREAMARSLLKANEVAEWSQEVAQQLIDGAFDEGELNTEIERKLNELEQEYAPELSNVKTQLAETEQQLDDRGVNVLILGVEGDGETNDAPAINHILENHKNVYFPARTYLVDLTDRIDVQSSSKLFFETGSIIKTTTANTNKYELIDIRDVENVLIDGELTIVGDRESNDSVSGEWGFGICIRGSKNIEINNVKANNFFGDGFYIGGSGGVKSENIVINNCHANNNRRQGLSVTHATNIKILNSSFNNSNGALPESGIILEPNEGEVVSDILIQNTSCSNNNGIGFGIVAGGMKTTLDNCSSYNNVRDGFRIIGRSAVRDGEVIINSCRSIQNGKYGFYSEYTSNNILSGNIIKDNGSDGVMLEKGTSKSHVVDNVILNNGGIGVYINSESIGEKTANGNIVEGNTIGSNFGGLMVTGAGTYGNKLLSNTLMDAERHGMWLGTTKQNIVSGNVIDNSGLHGLVLNSSEDCQIFNNIVTNSSVDDLLGKDNIYLKDSTNNSIQQNTARFKEDATRYGVRIEGNNINNILAHNDLKNSGNNANLSVNGNGVIEIFGGNFGVE